MLTTVTNSKIEKSSILDKSIISIYSKAYTTNKFCKTNIILLVSTLIRRITMQVLALKLGKTFTFLIIKNSFCSFSLY